MIAPGSYVEYSLDKRLMGAVCLKQDKPGRIYVRNARNQEAKLAEEKVLFRQNGFVSPTASYDEIRAALAKETALREEMAAQVNLEELWELLADEGEEHPWYLEELAELALGEAGDRERSALYRALEADSLFFQRKSNRYLIRSAEFIRETRQRWEKEASNKVTREALIAWLKNLWQNPLEYGAEIACPEEHRDACMKALDWLADVAIQGQDSRHLKDAQGLLKDCDITRRDAPFCFLVKCGRWTEHENLALHKANLSIDFSGEVEEDARALGEAGLAHLEDDVPREDLCAWETFAVDDATTTEIDDALSFEELENGNYLVGVHIADASSFVTPGSLTDTEAFERSTSVYLPDLKIRMLPSCLGEVCCSLVVGARRRAFSYIFEYTPDFTLVSSRMTPSLVQVDQHLTYDEADALLAEGRWDKFLKLARFLLEKRREAGAFTVPFPRVEVRVDADYNVRVEPEEANAPSQILVSEMMIQANRTAAEFLAQKGAPAIYRCQETPESPLELMTEFDPVKAYAVRRFLRKGTLSLEPSRHFGLGLDFYMQSTSPIRRYNDMMMQRQLKALVSGQEPFYTEDEVSFRLAVTRQNMAQADALERNRRTYWLLRYLEGRLHQEIEAVVVANTPNKHVVQLTDCWWEGEVDLIPGHPLAPGSLLPVRIELVWPRDGIVRLSSCVEPGE